MKYSNLLRSAAAIAAVTAVTGCATWNSMDRDEKGTAVGATGGAVVGAAVGGPVGALVGAGVGAYAGHYESDKLPLGPSTAATDPRSTSLVRSAQIALADRGYIVGPADGIWGPSTESAVSRFQRAQGLSQTGTLDRPTVVALGIG